MRDCPACGDPLSIHGVCGSCGYGRKKINNARNEEEAQRCAAMVAEARQRHAPTSADLTEQQWYNVCRFWPTVAKRCGRPFASVGPHNPLHATSRLGPVMRRFDPEAVAERQAIQEIV